MRRRQVAHVPKLGGKGDGALAGGDVRLHLTAAYAMAADTLKEADFVLAEDQT